ncbi:hypothetical protein JHK82_050363 [Glycine max]|nr:hypothetical protein JHK85_051000 [Glycine max]KAG5091585.1 hypothetical protein JHK82_050363 [Glycine max]
MVWCTQRMRNSCIFKGSKFDVEGLIQQVLFFAWCWMREGVKDFSQSFSVSSMNTGLLFVEGAGLGGAGANPSLGLQHRLIGPGQCRTAIRRRQRRVSNVELGKPELLDGGPIQRDPRQTEPSLDPLAFGEWEKVKARVVVVAENGVWWGEKRFGIVNQNFHGVQV